MEEQIISDGVKSDFPQLFPQIQSYTIIYTKREQYINFIGIT